METSDMLYNSFHLVMRWLHVIAGIAWIGHLYFFNFVNVQMQGSLDDATKKAVNPQLMPRALWWFRWGAMVTFVVGWILFIMNYMYTPGLGFGPTNFFQNAFGVTGRAWWILLGMLLGSIMWFNVWFVIWPAQKVILGGKAQPDQLPPLRARAAKFSKINTFLSGPMLFTMLAAPHLGDMNAVSLVMVILLGGGIIHLAYALSKNVGKTV
jgi:uncharacterized membrane protein